MKHYYHQANYHRYQRIIRRLKVAAIVFAGCVALGAVGVGGVYAWDQLKQQNQEAVTTETSSYYSAPVKIFQTEYFKFQTDNSWTDVSGEKNKPNTFYYRSFRRSFVEHELTIYVNNAPKDLMTTRVLPVNTTAIGRLLPAKVSENCTSKLSPANPTTSVVTLDGVKFTCDPHDSLYDVLVGRQGGDASVKLKRPNGTEATYVISYRNVTAQPEGSQLERIIETFEAR